MTKFRSSLLFCATICTVIVLALVVGAINYGSPNLQLFSHGPYPPPPPEGDGGSFVLAHGPYPPPPPEGDGGSFFIAHGPYPPPPPEGDGGSLRLA